MLIDSQYTYHRAYNLYLNDIRQLLKTHSRREISRLYPSIDVADIRLASEIPTPASHYLTIESNCLYQLRKLSRRQHNYWIKRIQEEHLSAPALRKLLRKAQRVVQDHPVPINNNIKREWISSKKS